MKGCRDEKKLLKIAPLGTSQRRILENTTLSSVKDRGVVRHIPGL